VEYAIESIKLGASALGMVTKEGVILAAERRIQSKLQVSSSIEKIFELDDHIACSSSG
jgi:20S proteasome subunit alpha 5